MISRIIAVIISVQYSACAMDGDQQQPTTEIKNGLNNVQKTLSKHLKNMLPSMGEPKHVLKDSQGTIGVIEGAQSNYDADTHSAGERYIHDLTLLSLWKYTLDRLMHYINLSKELAVLNDELAGKLRQIQAPQQQPILLQEGEVAREHAQEEVVLPRWGFWAGYASIMNGIGGFCQRQGDKTNCSIDRENKEKLDSVISKLEQLGFNKEDAVAFVKESLKAYNNNISYLGHLIDAAIKRNPQIQPVQLAKILREIDIQWEKEAEESRNNSSSSSSDSSSDDNHQISVLPDIHDIGGDSDHLGQDSGEGDSSDEGDSPDSDRVADTINHGMGGSIPSSTSSSPSSDDYDRMGEHLFTEGHYHSGPYYNPNE